MAHDAISVEADGKCLSSGHRSLKEAGGALSKHLDGNSCCGKLGSEASLECWDTGLTPAQHVGSRVWLCRSRSVGGTCGSDLIPGLGTPYAVGWPKQINKQTTRATTKHIGAWTPLFRGFALKQRKKIS